MISKRRSAKLMRVLKSVRKDFSYASATHIEIGIRANTIDSRQWDEDNNDLQDLTELTGSVDATDGAILDLYIYDWSEGGDGLLTNLDALVERRRVVALREVTSSGPCAWVRIEAAR